MTNKKQQALSDIVRISRQYQRSIRVDADIGRADALNGYICHATATAVVDGICKQLTDTNQRCFTWTGPFGGGKSSLAVALASALHPDKGLRSKARQALGLNAKSTFDTAFPVQKGWLIVPAVGRRGSVVAGLHAALRQAQGKAVDGRSKPTIQTLIADLLEESKNRPRDGVLVLIDEMGKFLEASALGSGDDVYFFQELAEAATRSEGRLVVVGVLHQSFAQYSARLGIDTRDDWAKIQGRYLDLPFVAASDEVVELIGRAIEADDRPAWMADASHAIADAIRSRRPAVGQNFAQALSLCWPLHPAMAALLGPISKRQFGQNERSTFGFLSSVEPHGFRSYLNSTLREEATWYRPSDYWDYLRSNLEPAILASPDGHRWSQAVEAVERAEAKTGDALLVSLIKNIAVIDLFRNGSGLAADAAVIRSLFYTRERELDAALQKLSDLKVALYKSYTGAWSIFEGSDFDIDAAIKQALAATPGIDYARLAHLMGLHPVVAKRHYHETGSMRWMELSLCSLEQAEKIAADFRPKKGEFGTFILALPSRGMKPRDARKRAQACSRLRPWPVMIGIPDNHARIAALSAELVALEQVKDRHELSGDAVARREVYARLAATRADLEDQLQAAVSLAKWHDGSDQVVEPGSKLSPVASRLAEGLFTDSPPVWSELVNRDNISSNSVKARRELLHAMIDKEGQEALGFEGFPAERGLYETLLKSTELHRKGESGLWSFSQPTEVVASGFKPLWDATRALFLDANARVGAHDIYALWGASPFGMKQGIQPVILTAFMLAHKANIAVYKDGVFVPRLTDFDIDECLQDPNRFSLRWVAIDEDKNRILEGISKVLAEIGENAGAADPLEAARGLVAMVFNMPEWARRTQRLGDTARAIRDMLLKASDPHKVLFVDLASLLNATDGKAYVKALRAPLKELAGAYGDMLSEVETKMFQALDASRDDLETLRTRASLVSGISGDLRLDAFAIRLANFDGSRAALEGILSLAAEKPPRDWVDRHIDVAILELAKFARHFREAEAYVTVQGRQAHSEAIAVVIGAGSDTQTISRSFAIPERHRKTVEAKAIEVASILDGQGLGTDVLLAILAKVGMKLVSTDKEVVNG
jgi:hypothetical protein